MRRPLAPVVASIALMLAAGCSSGLAPEATSTPSPTPSPTPTAFDVTGKIEVPAQNVLGDDGDDCTADDGYSDITEGAQVEVQDADGTAIALGYLGTGRLSGVRCSFPLSVVDVPEGQAIYAVKVGNNNRGALKYKREQLDQPVSLTIG